MNKHYAVGESQDGKNNVAGQNWGDRKSSRLQVPLAGSNYEKTRELDLFDNSMSDQSKQTIKELNDQID